MKAQRFHEEAGRIKRQRDEEAEPELPKIKSRKSDGKAKKVIANQDSTVVYLGHIPHGFFEKQIYEFFGQFGTVAKVKLCRNPKTKHSRGYAFIKFESPEVATEVAGAVNGYFLENRQLKCEVVPLEKQHSGLFLYPKKNNDAATSSSDAEKDDQPAEDDKAKPEETDDDVEPKPLTKKQIKEQERKQKKLAERGIDYNLFEVYQAKK